MARPKRMGAYNALDDLPPGRPRLEPVPDPPRSRRGSRRRRGGANALDDLLPGPHGVPGLDDLLPGPPVPDGRPAGPAPRGAGRHLGIWNPLDALAPAPGPVRDPAPEPVPARARVSFRLPADLVETARDAVAHLAGTADRTTLTALAERALRAELARLAVTHNQGRPFPPREA